MSFTSFSPNPHPPPPTSLKAFLSLSHHTLKHPPDTPIRSLLSAASSTFSQPELSAELERLTSHWVDNVNDLRLLQHEGMLRELGVSARFGQWLEEELTAVVPAAGTESRLNPSSSFSSSSASASASPAASIPPRLFVYQSDMDKEGLLYFLGTRGHSQPYTNPALIDLVRVTCIGTMKDSTPIQAVTGRDLVRCVTLADKEAWITVELVGVWLRPSHYTLRHYSSWDTECVRHWKLRASVDGRQWTDLSEHNNDESINSIGATHTWPLTLEGLPSAASISPLLQHCYRYFQLRLTGPNSNNHVYLACSGIELYGAMWTNEQYLAVAAQRSTDGFGAVNGWHVHDVEMRASPVSSPPPSSATSSTAPPFSPASSLTFSPSSPGQHYVYQHDLDHNGVVYAIATYNHTQPWRNAADAHLVSLSSSPLLEASAPLSSIVGPDVVRCVTQPRQGSWMAIDLLDKTVLLTAYTLRHYSSWDTEALRHWRLEASMDGERWALLREHVNDESLNAKGKAVTWMIDVNVAGCSRAYRMFRVTQTGENSNKHHYLACSGWELYGQLYAADGHSAYVWPTLPSAAVPSSPSASDLAQPQPMPSPFSASTFTFTPQHDFDENGVLHHIATSASFTAWCNPHLAGLITASASSLSDDSVAIDALVGHDIVRLVTQNIPQSWLAVDLRQRLLRLTHYTLRHYSSWDTECLRNWRLEGRRTAADEWTLIREHHNDDSLNGKGSTHTWLVRTSEWYSQFRIVQTSENSNRHHYLACSGWEMYGELREIEEKNGREPMELSAASDPTAMLISPVAQLPPQPQPPQPVVYQPTAPSPSSQKHSSPSQPRSQRDSFTFTSPHSSPPSVAAHSIFDSPASADLPSASLPVVAAPPPSTVSSSSSPSFDSMPFPSLPSFSSAEFNFPSPSALPTVSNSAVAPFPAASFDAASASPPALCYEWADHEKGQFLALMPSASSIVRNVGSSDKWQMARSVQSFSATTAAVHRIGIRVVVDPATSNTWRFILGVVPATLDCGGPKQWVGTGGSWGYIAGTGGKCHVSAKSEEYGEKYGDGDVVGIEMDFERSELRFYRNGVNQGVAYADLTGPVHVAASLTAQDSMLALVPWVGKEEETDKSEAAVRAKLAAQAARPSSAVSPLSSNSTRPPLHHSQSATAVDNTHPNPAVAPSFLRAATLPSPVLTPHLSSSWDAANMSAFLVLDPTNPSIVTNSGSSEKWQIVRSLASMPAHPNPHYQQPTTHSFQLEVLSAPYTPNSWQAIVGVVPAALTCGGSKQWVGAGGSWGYIGGTGGKCWTEPKSREYGKPWGAVGDVIECRLHVDVAGVGALEFVKNGRSQGIAFHGVTLPVHAAVSLTATGASVRLTMLS